jgi:GNAT superfamily N-acetyltransferase
MFDVPLEDRASETFTVELPDLADDWTIGVIVGPSGSGKSTIARAAYGDALYQPHEWPPDRAVIDCLGDAPTKDLAALLTAVGFSSPPSWIKPYHVLSGGEQFRCELARALLGKWSGVSGPWSEREDQSLVVFDEFTSVVDRTVAKVGSAAVAKAVRRGLHWPLTTSHCPLPPLRFIAVTCHYDVVPWLEPDWVLDMATGELTRRRLRRPEIRLEVVRCPQRLWTRFRRHHYLSGELARAATCYAALWNGEPVAFCATTGMYGRVGRKRITRIVVLPDYQGLGIGLQLAEIVAQREADQGFRCNLTASHPAVINHCRRSASWRLVGVKRAPGQSFQTAHGEGVKTAVGRSVVSFEWEGGQRSEVGGQKAEVRGQKEGGVPRTSY